MWWEARTESEISLAGAVRQLRVWYREQIARDQPVAWGIGSAWDYVGEHRLQPFVLLNRELFVGDRFAAALEPRFPVPIELFEIPSLLESQRGQFNPLQTLPRFGGSLRLLGMAVGRPRKSSRLWGPNDVPNRYLAFTDPIVCRQTGEQGTAAVKVWDTETGEAGLLTAGHVFPRGEGSWVDRVSKKWWRLQRREELGQVSHCVQPTDRTASWDVAVIRLTKPTEFHWADAVVKMFERFNEPVYVVAFGATSGAVREAAILRGALDEGGAGEVHWKNCWMAGPSGVLASGDSGAAIFAVTGEFLGVYVGCADFEASGTVLTHFVQDAYSIERELLSGWKMRF